MMLESAQSAVGMTNCVVLYMYLCAQDTLTMISQFHHQNLIFAAINSTCTYIHFRHDGLIIMATNRPYDLDEAMHRRIMIAVEFRQPDHLLRKAIWESHVPKEMKLSDDIDLVG